MKLVNKKIQIIVLALIVLGTVAACDWGKSTTIVNKTNNFSQRIKYSGKVVFNEKEDGIEHISNGGYLEFEQNGKGFKARESAHGKIKYEFNGDNKVTQLNDEQREFVSRAVKSIIKERAKLNHPEN